MVVRHAHEGPKEIGVSDVFLDWLLDPDRNDGRALYDFGCYGTNPITWLMEGRRPDAVTARIRQIKGDPSYRVVDEKETIIVEYPETQGTIQAS